MLIAKRNAMSGKKLPYKRRVKYLVSRGAQWMIIPLNRSVNNNPVIDLDIKMPKTFAAVDGSFVRVRNGVGAANLTFSTGLGFSDSLWGVLRSIEGGLYLTWERYFKRSEEISVSVRNNSFTANGVRYLGTSSVTIPRSFDQSKEITICIMSSGAIQSREVGIGECKIGDSDGVVNHLIPCIDNEDKPAMYDEISKILYHNQGSGDFDVVELPVGGGIVDA